MDRKFKPLRPAIPSPTPSESGQASRSQSAAPFRRKKRIQVKVACDICRLKKSACDGQRPLCSACVRRGSACTFGGRPADTPGSSSSLTPNDSERNNEAVEVLGLLASAPADEALDMLIELRSHNDTSAALKHIRFNRELQEYNLPSFFPPPDQDSTEFELMTRHPVLYPVSIPLDFPQPPTSLTRQQSQTGSLESELYGGLSDSSSNQNYWVPDFREFDASPIPDTSMSIDSSMVPRELDTPTLHDPRLERVNFSNWTDIPVNHSEAAQAVSDYLRLDHPVMGLFDVDPFLDDLASNRTSFCSPLLVNALLGWRLVNHNSQPGPVNDFYHNALNLLSINNEPDSLTKLAALELLSLTSTYQGHGKTATKLLGLAIGMGKSLQLLTDGASASNLPTLPALDVKAASYAAWGLFSFATLHSLHCQRCELGATTSPPILPIPSSSESDPRSKSPVSSIPSYSTLSFEHLCRLCVIIHDMVVRYYARDRQTGQQDAAHMDFVGVMSRRFFHWGHDLPLSLARGNKSTHDSLTLHIYFHAAIITLFRPLVVYQAHGMNLGLSTSDANPADTISRASISQLKRLMISYQSRSPAELSTVHWHTASLYVANAMIRGHGEYKGRRSYFSRCLESYKMLYPRYAVTIPIFKGLLSMAVSSGIITSQEAYDALGQLLTNKGHHNPVAEPTQSCFMIDLDLALTDMAAAHIDTLAQRFDDMVMFENFTHGRADEDGGVSLALP